METIKLGMIALHIAATAIALGAILKSDLAMVRSLLTGKRGPAHDIRHLRRLKRTTASGLQLLWLSGLALLAMQVSEQGHEVLLQTAFQIKFCLVLLLTLNGCLLHRAVLPSLERAGSLLRLSLPRCVLSVAAGTLASVSWWYAGALGGASLGHLQLPWAHCLASYPVVLAAGITGMLLIASWAQARDASIWRGERVVT